MFNKQKVTTKYEVKPSLTGNCKVYKITLHNNKAVKKQMVKKGLTFEDANNFIHKIENKNGQ